ncbi:MAG TPA: hypothetical protein VM942_03955, partial [Acidimicrobiales bacterium]|nr:hypothetical protein [Acidimicrobiales bacterium]
MTVRDAAPSLGTTTDRPRRASDLLASVGSLLLPVAVGVNLLFWGILWWKPPATDRARLTNPGLLHIQPERDVLVYGAAGLMALVLAALLARSAARPRHLSRTIAPIVGPVVAVVSIVVATAAFLRFRGEVVAGVRRPGKYLLVFGLVTGACLAAAWLTRRAGLPGGWPLAPLAPLGSGDGEPPPRRRMRLGVVDVVAPVMVALTVYVPGWRMLAANAYAGELFLHLDFFAMGPAVAFRHGAALGTD